MATHSILKRGLAATLVLSTLLSVAPAKADNPGGAFLGWLLGGAVGNIASRGGSAEAQAAATGVGMIIGAIIGNNIGDDIDDYEKQRIERAVQRALDRNDQYIWRSSRSSEHDIKVVVTPQREGYMEDDGLYRVCREFRWYLYVDGDEERDVKYACRDEAGTWVETRKRKITFDDGFRRKSIEASRTPRVEYYPPAHCGQVGNGCGHQQPAPMVGPDILGSVSFSRLVKAIYTCEDDFTRRETLFQWVIYYVNHDLSKPPLKLSLAQTHEILSYFPYSMRLEILASLRRYMYTGKTDTLTTVDHIIFDFDGEKDQRAAQRILLNQ